MEIDKVFLTIFLLTLPLILIDIIRGDYWWVLFWVVIMILNIFGSLKG